MKDMKLIMENFNKFLAEQVDYDKAQKLINSNTFLRDVVKLEATADNMIEGGNYVLFYSPDSLKHIKNRHMDADAPGSLFKDDIDLKDTIKNLLSKEPSETGDRVKWLGVEVDEEVGKMGVEKANPEKVSAMKDYTMPGERQENVKITAGERKPTKKMTLVTGNVGKLDGKQIISLITAFPGSTEIDGVEMPMDRNNYAEKGFYFVLPEDSPLLADEKSEEERLYTDNWKNALEDEDDKEKLNPNENPYGKEIQFAHSQLRSLLNKNKNPSEDEIIKAIQDGWDEARYEA